MRVEALKRYCEGWSQGKIALELGISRQRVNYWRKADQWTDAKAQHEGAQPPLDQTVRDLMVGRSELTPASLELLRHEFMLLMQELFKMGKHPRATLGHKRAAIESFAGICKSLGVVTRRDLERDQVREADVPQVATLDLTGPMVFNDDLESFESMAALPCTDAPGRADGVSG